MRYFLRNFRTHSDSARELCERFGLTVIGQAASELDEFRLYESPAVMPCVAAYDDFYVENIAEVIKKLHVSDPVYVIAGDEQSDRLRNIHVRRNQIRL